MTPRGARRALAIALSVAIAIGFAGVARAMKLPLGLTPELIKQIMTPLRTHPKAMPANTVPFEGCIPSMGYHYAEPGNVPFGPYYGYYNGKAVFTEVMIDRRFLESGKSWDDLLKPLPGYTIDHIDIWFEPMGHPGYRTPHYDIHAWYVPHNEHMKYCGNASGQRPRFL